MIRRAGSLALPSEVQHPSRADHPQREVLETNRALVPSFTRAFRRNPSAARQKVFWDRDYLVARFAMRSAYPPIGAGGYSYAI